MITCNAQIAGAGRLRSGPNSRSCLPDALHVMERSELVHDALGDHIFEWFLRNKRREWRDYKTHVSQFELDRYLRSM